MKQKYYSFSWNLFFERRLSEIKGILSLFLGFFLFFSLISWSPHDPGIHRAIQTDYVHNLGGFTGAYLADFLFWAVGFAIFPYIALLVKIGGRCLFKQKINWHPLRIVSLFFVGLSSAIFLTHVPSLSAMPPRLGGFLGEKLQSTFFILSTEFIHLSQKATLIITCISSLTLMLFSLYVLLKRDETDTPLPFKMKWPEKISFSWPNWTIMDNLKWLKNLPLQGWTGAREVCSSFITLVKSPFKAKPKEEDQNFSYQDFSPSLFQKENKNPFSSTEPIGTDTRIKKREEKILEETDPGFIIHTPEEPSKKVFPSQREEGRFFRSSSPIKNFSLPPLNLLSEDISDMSKNICTEKISSTAKLLENVLKDFGVHGKIVRVNAGPVVTLYELEPSPGTKSSRVIALSDDIARSMCMVSARVAIVPGRNIIGIELPNAVREQVSLRGLFETNDYHSEHNRLPLALGKNIGGMPVIADLSRMPHLLVAGTTGSGKSVSINAMILSLIYSLAPDMCKLILIDPKMLELSVYNDIPHLLTPVVTEPKKAIVALKWVVKEMENRYRYMTGKGVRNILSYNQKAAILKNKIHEQKDKSFSHEDLVPMPYIVVVIDEMADLMLVAGKEIESAVQRLAQMARAAGIHMIMATQRPSVDVITGTIKANFPTRISFQVTSKIDSRTILGEQGAEQLLGQGDMLYMLGGGRIIRLHGPFVSDHEIDNVVTYLKSQGPEPDYVEEVTQDLEDQSASLGSSYADDEDEESLRLYQMALEIVLKEKIATTSYIQRKLRIGYNRAARIIEKMESQGIVSSPNHQGKREILQRDL